MLLTSCKDNICRLWCETILPEDGLVDVTQLEPHAAANPLYHTHRHKNRIMQRVQHVQRVMHKRKRSAQTPTSGVTSQQQQHSSLSSEQSVHDFHKFGIHPNSVAPGFHFHLAGTINPDTGTSCDKYEMCSLLVDTTSHHT